MKTALQHYWQNFLARRHPLAQLELSLVHKRIYIVPSKQGLGFFVLIVLALIGAINYQLSLGFMFAFLLIGLAASALLRTYLSLLGLHIRSSHADPVFAGDAARFPLIFKDRQGRSRLGITLCPQQDIDEHSIDIAPFNETRSFIDIPSTQRGYLRLPRSRLECRTPTGWFVAWTYLTLASECLVYPKAERNPPPLPLGGQIGQHGMTAAQGDEDFAGLRPYHAGDAPRRVAWKQAAHSDQLLTKQFQSPLSGEVILDWHQLEGLDTESRLSRLCAWVLQAELEGHRYALLLPKHDNTMLDHGYAHQQSCLRALALYPSDAAP